MADDFSQSQNGYGDDIEDIDAEILDAEVELFEVPIPQDQSAPVQLSLLDMEDESPAAQPQSEPPAGNGAPPAPAPGRPHRRSATATGTDDKPKRPRMKQHPMLLLPAWGTIKRAWSIFTINPTPFLLIGILGAVLQYLPTLSRAFLPGILGVIVRQMGQEAVTSLFFGVFTYAVFLILAKGELNIGAAFVKGMSRLVPVAAASAIVVAITYCGIIIAYVATRMGLNGYLAKLLFFDLLSLVLTCMLLMTVPVCVVERLGPIASIRRGLELTKGFRWPIFWIITIWYLFLAGLIFLLSISFIIPGIVRLLLVLVTLTISVPMKYIIYSIIYYELRKTKDGVSVDKLVHVFD